ncbi:MAG: B12-binding domain-containing radical SAM protein [Bacteroidales bacterium]|nr:B12-binding domain-containing radical SAM protein [Bacteroidales bacterium]
MDAERRRKLILVNPVNRVRIGFMNSEGTIAMPLGLGIVAALTPENWEVELVDEYFGEFTLKPADIVALTGFTPAAYRAYEIAAICRQAGIHTVMGGIHASMCPEEAARFVDTVFLGEAEGAWPALIDDFEAGRIKSRYDGGIVAVNDIASPRRDIFDRYPYVYDLLQTSRGCPMGCEFCSVTQMCGKTYREREINAVIADLEKTRRPLLFFVDDNLVNNKKGSEERAINLFKAMVDRGLTREWYSQAAVNFAANDEVLHWARKSGCYMVLMGIEAEKPQALKDVRKNLNLRLGTGNYDQVFKKMHRHGIGILASMIFAMDSDSVDGLYARRDFILKSSIDTYQCTVLTPLPGTILFDRMQAENKIVMNDYPSDWQQYDGMVATSRSATLEREEIEQAMRRIWMDLYHKETLRKKMFRTLWNTRSFKTAYRTYATGHNYGRMFLERFIKNKDGINEKLEWIDKKRSIFLRITDLVIWLFYRIAWQKSSEKLNPK